VHRLDPGTTPDAHETHRRLTIDTAVLERVNLALEEIRNGKMIILVDDEDRENEGDLVLAAERVTPEAINFMAKHGRGLICLALDEAQVEQLGLPMMSAPGRGGPPLGTAFTVSIEAAEGVTTGISAADRARTVQAAISPTARPSDVVTPGHVFPLKARRGGVLVRTGQTEGAVDLARLAGMRPAGVICEIMKDDGEMARMPDLEEFAAQHGLCILTVADLIQYRLQTETLVQRVEERPVVLDATGSEWLGIVYEVAVEERQALALVKGDIADGEPVLCRVHSGSVVADLFCSTPTEGGHNLREAIRHIEAEGRGVLLYLAPARTLGEELGALARPSGPRAAAQAADSVPDGNMRSSHRARLILRKFGLGAQMLADLGARKLRLLTNSQRKIAGLTGYGLEIVERVALSTPLAAPQAAPLAPSGSGATS
jgi:3,4-dihydroxy 2-butanone 4-phosphate synthase / GTP cyclohydrolase II